MSFDPNQVGLFLWAKVPNVVQSTNNFIDEILHTAHVFITPGSVFGTNGDRYVRLSLCSSKETFESALERIVESKKLKLAV